MTEIINLAGKNALITGGTRGIGKGIARQLAQAGADMALFYRGDAASAEATKIEIATATGRRVEVYQANVSDEAQVEAGVERAFSDFGGAGFDIVVHNAGGGDGGGSMPSVRTEQWRGVLGVNLDAAFFLTRALLAKQGALSDGASIIFIASGAGHDLSLIHI